MADRYLLRTPLAVGAKWSAVENVVVQRFEVVDVNASAVTEAGTFTRCAGSATSSRSRRAEGSSPSGRTRPGRLVQLVTSTLDPAGSATGTTRLQLVAYRIAQ